MESIQWENIDRTLFSIFIRDLTHNTNINLKHLIEDIDKKTIKNNPKKHIKKKDLIIQENEKRKYKQMIQSDTKKLTFMLESILTDDPFISIQKLKTNEIKNKFKIHLLEVFWKDKKKHLDNIFILYYHLKDNFPEEKIIIKIRKKLENYDCKAYMLENLGHQLPPLNFWNKTDDKLDEWQINTINLIKKKESCIVKAPTSSGKTFIAMATGILFKKILYVCPAKPVAYQVGANYVKMGYKVCFLLENHPLNYISNDMNIFIGTPEIIENYLYKIGTTFDYAVFDEIHNLNDFDIGMSYENIIKLVDSNFLALSATIENIDFLKSIFKRYHPNKYINEIIYNKRFINQQRWIYQNNSFQMIHPISCLDTSNFNDFKYISFTPKDCIQLYNRLETIFEDYDDDIEELIENYSPDEIFKEDRILTLDDIKIYENKMKELCQLIYNQYPEKINQLVDSYKIQPDIKENKVIEDELISFFRESKQKDLLPMIYFHSNEETIFELFNKVNDLLYKSEKENYPYHYTILEKKKDLYDKYINDRETYESKIKISSKNAIYEKQDKLKQYDKKQRLQFIQTITEYYDSLMSKCKSSLQKKNLMKEKNDFLKYPSFNNPDIHIKHKDFCFTNIEPMSGNDIRTIRRDLKKSCNLSIDYESPLFQLLKRGIGVYIEAMPDKYNWILQKLMSEKKLGIILSSKILCLGIDLPIRSVCLSGYKSSEYSSTDYLQMSGRAGRRGHDNQGNIIFHNISNYSELMKQKLPKIEGSMKHINPSYQILSKLNKNISLTNLFKNPINEKNKELIQTNIHCHPNYQLLLWKLRYFKNSELFLKHFEKIEKQLFLDDHKIQYLFSLLNTQLLDFDDSTIYTDFKLKKISKNENYYRFKIIGNIVRDICNSLNKKNYKITIDTSYELFTICKQMIYNHYHLTS